MVTADASVSSTPLLLVHGLLSLENALTFCISNAELVASVIYNPGIVVGLSTLPFAIKTPSLYNLLPIERLLSDRYFNFR